MSVFDPELAARMKMPKELLDRASELHFAIHIGLNSVHAALYDFGQSECPWHVHSELPPGISAYTFIYQRNWLEGVFRRCTITFDTDVHALVPQSFFDAEACQDYIRMQHGMSVEASGFIELPESESVICYELPEWHAGIIRLFPNARIMPLGALLVRLAFSKSRNSETSLLAAISSASATFVCLKKNALVLLATHEARSAEDVLYHLSNAAMRLQIDLAAATVEVLNADSGNEGIQLMKQYVREVNVLEVNPQMSSFPVTQLHYLCA
jgi:hypothetical protein